MFQGSGFLATTHRSVPPPYLRAFLSLSLLSLSFFVSLFLFVSLCLSLSLCLSESLRVALQPQPSMPMHTWKCAFFVSLSLPFSSLHLLLPAHLSHHPHAQGGWRVSTHAHTSYPERGLEVDLFWEPPTVENKYTFLVFLSKPEYCSTARMCQIDLGLKCFNLFFARKLVIRWCMICHT